jgi:hypothetical protein
VNKREENLMRLSSIILMGALGLALAAPARAEEKADPFAQMEALLRSGALMRGVIREDDVSLLFDHVRAAMLAASQGREAPLPAEALGRRGEEIAAELKVRGTTAGLLLITAFEAMARQAVREHLAAPPSTPR